MRGLDFSSWQSLLATLIGLALVTLIGVGIRLLMMVTIQQRRERVNRQINERLRTLIAAYKALGGSFTGNLTVDPHASARPATSAARRRRRREVAALDSGGRGGAGVGPAAAHPRCGRGGAVGHHPARHRGACAAGRPARRANWWPGRPVHTHDLVVSLRNFIREALDLDPIPADLAIPMQGPTRPSGGGGRAAEGGERGETRRRRRRSAAAAWVWGWAAVVWAAASAWRVDDASDHRS